MYTLLNKKTLYWIKENKPISKKHLRDPMESGKCLYTIAFYMAKIHLFDGFQDKKHQKCYLYRTHFIISFIEGFFPYISIPTR